MKLLIDMNLSPDLADIFIEHGWQALHWSAIGDPRADDPTIMKWAIDNGYVVFTHDLVLVLCWLLHIHEDQALYRFARKIYYRKVFLPG